MTQLVGILGYPLTHSISPVFQQAAFDHYALSVRYCSWATTPERLENETRRLRGLRYLGANVTVPHKEKVRAHLDDIDPWADLVGAVNTIVVEGNRLVGYNTDTDGFITALKERGEFDPRGKRVLIIGAGGAARAATFGLAREHISVLTIANRSLERAQRLADDVRDLVSEVMVVSAQGDSLEEAVRCADLIVNSTTVGMKYSGVEGCSMLYASMISPGTLVYDMVYNPPLTPLLIEAKRAGARILGGLPMLIYQGAASFEYWTGKTAPIEVMFRSGEEALTCL